MSLKGERGKVLAPVGHLAASEIFMVVTAGGVGREDVTGIYWVEVRNSVRYPTVHRIIFKTMNDPPPAFNCSEVEIRPVGRKISKND